MSDGFFSRWSRLKRGDAQPVVEPKAEPLLEPRAEPAVTGLPEAMMTPETAPEPDFDVTTLPDIETATVETDFTAFLRKGVPDGLKHQALRRAWILDPGIRNFVGPADYAWDFNAEGGVPGFSLTLGGDVTKLLAQAIGQIERVAEALPDVPSFLPPGATASPPTGVVEAAPEDPLRLSAAEEMPAGEVDPESMLEAEAARPRRHGGATPT